MFVLPDSWVWDFWFADDGETYHLFFLYASKALHDPERRHYRASIGHAVSADLVSWTRIEDALVRADAPAFDDLATWTGSIVRHPDGTWFLFYTGSTAAPDGRNVQRIGYATSQDLVTWQRNPENPVLAADPRWYETLDAGVWHDEAFRDPWVFADPDGDGWHMLVTARARSGEPFERGVIGHAVSADLKRWEPRPPLTVPSPRGFGQLEVAQVEVVDGRPVLLFSCLAEHASADRRATGTTGGVWAAPAGGLLGPFDIAAAEPVTDDRLYSGRLIRRRSDDQWVLITFHNRGEHGFVGAISDPVPVAWDGKRLGVLGS